MLGLHSCPQPFCSCGEPGPRSGCGVWAHCGDFSCCGAWTLGSTGSAVEVQGLCCPTTCGLFWTRIKLMSPALTGGFSTTGPLGKSPFPSFYSSVKTKLFLTTQRCLLKSVVHVPAWWTSLGACLIYRNLTPAQVSWSRVFIAPRPSVVHRHTEVSRLLSTARRAGPLPPF